VHLLRGLVDRGELQKPREVQVELEVFDRRELEPRRELVSRLEIRTGRRECVVGILQGEGVAAGGTEVGANSHLAREEGVWSSRPATGSKGVSE